MNIRFDTIAASMFLLVFSLVIPLVGGCSSADNTSYQNISLDQFIQMLEQKDFILINVHIPYEGEIPGTDLLLPFNKLDQHWDELPGDKEKKIVVYCMAGPMGYNAADKLATMGYTKVAHFEGGMKAWSRSGKPLAYRKK